MIADSGIGCIPFCVSYTREPMMFSSAFAASTARWRHHPYYRAIGLMLLSTLGFSAMSVGVRLLSPDMGAAMIVTWRNGVTLLLLLPWALRNKAALIRTDRLRDHGWRSLIGSVGMLTWTYCLTLMPLAHATALSFTAPLIATVFAILFLKERVTRYQVGALGAGLIGTLIILQPDPAGFEWNSLLVIFATSAWAVAGILVKSLSRTEPPLRMVFYMNLFMLLIALPFGLLDWRWPDMHGWAVLLVIALSSIVMHFTMAKAFALAPLVTLLPVDFMRLVYTSLFAYLLFGETNAWTSWIGAAIIIASAVFLARRNARTVDFEAS